MERKALGTEMGGGGVALRQVLAESAEILRDAGNRNPVRDAELLLLHVTRLNRTVLITQPERLLSASELQQYRELIARRAGAEPIQYITGEREFYGLRFIVTPDVLIPRPETEHLVEVALERIPHATPYRIADIGTGSGAVAIAIAVARPAAIVTAVDISHRALQVSKQNASVHQVSERIDFVEGDLLEGLAAASFDMIVSNPPYIAAGERDSLEAEVREFEPATALFAGQTGLEIYERLIPQAASALRSEGWLLMEIGAGQQPQLLQLLKDWSNVSFMPDLQGIPRVSIAQRP